MTITYDEILVPTDGSGGSQPYLEHAIGLARERDARIHALSVVDTRIRSSLRKAVRPDINSSLQVDAETAIESIRGAAERAGLHAVTEIRRGLPHEEILEYASENDIDLIVMATHAREGASRAALGSVTERVLRQSPVPVLTVHLDEHRS